MPCWCWTRRKGDRDYSGQIISYQKLVGQLQDAGSTATIAHYLALLSGAGLVTGLQKFSGARVRQRGSSPKLVVLNTALMSALAGLDEDQARTRRDLWGRLVESAVGAHLVNSTPGPEVEVLYWRDRGLEVDFVVRWGERVVGLEVKSGPIAGSPSGLAAFRERFAPLRTLIVGGDGIALDEFLARPVTDWLA